VYGIEAASGIKSGINVKHCEINGGVYRTAAAWHHGAGFAALGRRSLSKMAQTAQNHRCALYVRLPVLRCCL